MHAQALGRHRHDQVPASSPQLVESKSLKLYLNSFNATRFDDAESVRTRIVPIVAGGGRRGRSGFRFASVRCRRRRHQHHPLAIDIDDYGPPNAQICMPTRPAWSRKTLRSDLLKSNCPVTGQPDWGGVRIAYRGPRIDRAGLLRYWSRSAIMPSSTNSASSGSSSTCSRNAGRKHCRWKRAIPARWRGHQPVARNRRPCDAAGRARLSPVIAAVKEAGDTTVTTGVAPERAPRLTPYLCFLNEPHVMFHAPSRQESASHESG